ncbi:MAG: RodZ domain-containing protein [Candidatus Omnitrophota bacterium]
MSHSLGTTLKKLREAKDLSIKEVSERTRIPKSIISNIEEDKVEAISSSFYARSFVRSYSEFLNATEEKSVKDFLSRAPKKDTPSLELKPQTPVETKISFDWLVRHKTHIIQGVATVVGIWILFLGVLGVKNLAKNAMTRHREKVKLVEVVKKAEAPKPAPLPKEEPKVEPVVEEKKIEASFELEILARYNVWLEVVSDGGLKFRGILKKGEKDIWHAEEAINLKIGNAGATLFKLDGKSLGSPGGKGEKVMAVVTKDGFKKQQ